MRKALTYLSGREPSASHLDLAERCEERGLDALTRAVIITELGKIKHALTKEVKGRVVVEDPIVLMETPHGLDHLEKDKVTHGQLVTAEELVVAEHVDDCVKVFQ